uniref:E2 ubiquitin-conjugating enzyme n=1 Tax=Chlamydomonas euryale TaxID=1486919 RepID=A0A7R9YSD4_9CHLO|mmetsp:Transcript_18284/g.54565  ORF Transcript_18284/g.54565 Transcript_18284/m.54565 type:complete len:192 (+) Transcript_18284:291-866(+)
MCDVGRLQKELREIARDEASGVTVKMVDNSLQHLIGCVPGPRDSPYDGGIFQVDIKLSDGYPFEPPKMRFITKVWHPNVSSQTGAICLDILKDAWSPALTLKTAMLSLQALLACPEPKDPQDAQVAEQYTKDNKMYVSTAQYWTAAYARPDDTNEKVGRLVDMGFSSDSAKKALAACGGDENVALEKLLGA